MIRPRPPWRRVLLLSGALLSPRVAWALSCDEILNMVMVNVPTNIVAMTIKDSGEDFSSEVLSCLERQGAPAEVQAAWRALRRPTSDSKANVAPPAPVSPSAAPARPSAEGKVPPEVQAAVELARAGKHDRAAPALFALVQSGRFLEQEPRLLYLLASSLEALNLDHSAQIQFIEVVKKGTAGAYFSPALEHLVHLAERTGDWTDIDRIFPKVPPEAVPRSIRATYHYRMGRRSLRDGDLTEAKKFLDQVPEGSLTSLRARFLSGSIYGRQAKLKSAMRMFLEVAREASRVDATAGAQQREVDLLVDLSLLNTARLYYSIERYANALEYYALVSSRGPTYSTAAFEAAWAAFMMDDRAGARSHLGRINGNATAPKKRQTLIDKGRSDEVIWPLSYPESDVLAALIEIEDCRADAARARLDAADALRLPLASELSSFVKAYATEDGKKRAENAFDSFFRSESGDLGHSRALRPTLLQDRELAGLVDHISRMNVERARIQAQGQDWGGSGLTAALVAGVAEDQTRLRRRAGLVLLGELATEANRLQDISTQVSQIRSELASTSASARARCSAGAPASATAVSAAVSLPVRPAQPQAVATPVTADRARERGGRRGAAEEPDDGLPIAVRAALERAGWTPTFNHSATFTAGDILRSGSSTPVVFGKECFIAEPREGGYSSLDVIQALQAGGRLPLLGSTELRADGMQYKQVRFADPFVSELSEMTMTPTEPCLSFLRAQRVKGEDLSQWVVIQAVMKAEIKEQVCRELEAAVGLGAVGVSAGMSSQCLQGSNGQVAVAFKLRPVLDLIR